MTAVDLLPCAHCGGEAWLNDYEAKHGDMTPESRCPQCKSCGCNLGYLPTEAKAIAAWNRRAPVSAGKVKALVWASGYRDETVAIEQAAPAASYQIRAFPDEAWLDIGGHKPTRHPTLDAAKAAAQADFEARILSALVPGDGWQPTHRHVKRGTEYREVARGMLQTDVPLGDYAELVAYHDADGVWWFRPPSEFDDGRFAPVPQINREEG